MAFDTAPAFELLRHLCRSGLLNGLVAIADRAVDGLIRDTGMGMGELLAILDSAPLETVLRVEEAVASADLAEVAAKLEQAASDPGAAVARLRACLERAVRETWTGLPAHGR